MRGFPARHAPGGVVLETTTARTFLEETEPPTVEEKEARVAEGYVHWNGELNTEATQLLRAGGAMCVVPTKVGYIIATTDSAGLERKFAVKNRKRNKPAVVLCGSMEELETLAQLTPEIRDFYQKNWDEDILMGCILPWRAEAAEHYIPEEGEARNLVRDGRGTSCFVIRYGKAAEQIAAELWEKDKKLVFASSANPSGRGNRGKVEGIGTDIATEADLVIEADDYVTSIQPDASEATRWEQGVMVSFVDESGKLVPEQNGQRMVTPAPVLIRKGVYLDRILQLLSESFLSWDFRQGAYY